MVMSGRADGDSVVESHNIKECEDSQLTDIKLEAVNPCFHGEVESIVAVEQYWEVSRF